MNERPSQCVHFCTVDIAKIQCQTRQRKLQPHALRLNNRPAAHHHHHHYQNKKLL